MSSPNLIIADNIPSPSAENQQSDEVKLWNKSSIDKITNPCSLISRSPHVESAPTSPLPTQKTFSRQNGISNRKKMRLDEDEYESLEMACNLASEINDDCDAFGKHVAAQLRQMTKMQKFMAQRLISEICFRGQIQHLNLNTNVVNGTMQQLQSQQPQPHLQATLFAPRPPHLPATMYGRTPDYLLLHQQAMRPSGAIPQHTYQNFAQAQSDHSSVPLEHVG